MLRHVLNSLLAMGVFVAPADAQTSHDHGKMALVSAVPTEPGQGAFAAISEIVAMLMADPKTDWSRVDISTLRDHLVDMDLLVTHANVSVEHVSGGSVFQIATTGSGGGAAGRMVPAHAPFLTAETGWSSEVALNGDQLIWTVTSDTDEQAIRVLGFFGLMAVGAHHQEHHMGMATGKMVH